MSEAELRRLYRRYLAGESPGQLAVLFGVTASALRQRFKRAGFRCRTQREGAALAAAQGRSGIRPRQKRGPEHQSWKGGRYRTKAGYIRVRDTSHPRAGQSGYVNEHILVWEGCHGRPLPRGWHVHHLNGVKDDNRPENLEAMPARDHLRYLATQQKHVRKLEAEIRRLRALLKKHDGEP